MFRQRGLTLIAVCSIACALMILPTRLDAKGAPGKGFVAGSSINNEPSANPAGQQFPAESSPGTVSSAAVFAYVPPAPATYKWANDRLSRTPTQREDTGEFTNWGYWIGPNYWGVVEPLGLGGFPFSYATLDYGLYWNPYYGLTPHEFNQFDDGLFDPPERRDRIPADTAFFIAARAQFYAGNYPEALRDVEHATIDLPASPSLQEFHALVLYALGDYRKAAAVAHPVLNAGQGWDWAVLQTFYPSVDLYTRQLRALEQSVSEHASDHATRFLLAYHYLMLGHQAAARVQLQQVVEFQPRDLLAKNILAGLNNAPGAETESHRTAAVATANQSPGGSDRAVTGRPAARVERATPESATALSGLWTSHPVPGVAIEATLDPGGHFVWAYKENGQSRTFTGRYIHQGESLVFSREDGQMMDGLLTLQRNNRFWFRLKSAEPSDPGLVFSK